MNICQNGENLNVLMNKNREKKLESNFLHHPFNSIIIMICFFIHSYKIREDNNNNNNRININ